MLNDCFERRMTTASTITLYLILAVNIYNLTWLYDDSPTTLTLLGDNIETKQRTIVYQTIALIFAIIFSTIHYTSPLILIIRYWCFGITFITLIFDLLFTFVTARYVLRKSTLDEYWKIKTNQEESKSPIGFHFIAMIILAAYFVFKFYATLKIIRFGIDHRDGKINGSQEFIRNIDDIERNTPREPVVSSEPPPPYDQCMTESTPPPPYRAVA